VSERDCVDFLQWALPQLRMRWAGFRKVRRQVCKRIARRRHELGLPDLAAYHAYLETHPGEWSVLDAMCRVTISRFYRDAGVFAALGREVLPALARSSATVAAWSVGCASGEEPYTLALLWKLELRARFPNTELTVLGTDVDRALLRRAEEGCYSRASLKELPKAWLRAFEERDSLVCLETPYREPVRFVEQDIRAGSPDGRFDLILCRNLVFTYFELDLQREVLARLAESLHPGGALVVGAHETLPDQSPLFTPWPKASSIHRRDSSVTLV
jgi:chemotaxis protein methyltransferase CheR